jgi:hypothetical protein
LCASSPGGRSSPTSGPATTLLRPTASWSAKGSLKYEHLYRLEIPDAIALAEDTEAYRTLYNEIRPHEALEFATPLSRYLADPEASNLFGPQSVQES